MKPVYLRCHPYDYIMLKRRFYDDPASMSPTSNTLGSRESFWLVDRRKNQRHPQHKKSLKMEEPHRRDQKEVSKVSGSFVIPSQSRDSWHHSYSCEGLNFFSNLNEHGSKFYPEPLTPA